MVNLVRDGSFQLQFLQQHFKGPWVAFRKVFFPNPGIPTTLKTMGVNITTIVNPKGFNHPNWVNHYFNGGGSLGQSFFFKLKVGDILMYLFMWFKFKGRVFHVNYFCELP